MPRLLNNWLLCPTLLIIGYPLTKSDVKGAKSSGIRVLVDSLFTYLVFYWYLIPKEIYCIVKPSIIERQLIVIDKWESMCV